jgi:hypothetical protein
MRTLWGDVTSPTCTECKVRGYLEVKDSYPVCKTCMCKCDTGVFIYRDIERMTSSKLNQRRQKQEKLFQIWTQGKECPLETL